jgi:predicted  nucleic acid-binding Zn-ribbon protein
MKDFIGSEGKDYSNHELYEYMASVCRKNGVIPELIENFTVEAFNAKIISLSDEYEKLNKDIEELPKKIRETTNESEVNKLNQELLAKRQRLGVVEKDLELYPQAKQKSKAFIV